MQIFPSALYLYETLCDFEHVHMGCITNLHSTLNNFIVEDVASTSTSLSQGLEDVNG